MLLEYIRFAVDGIRNRSLRSWLTTIGVLVGVMSVVALISLGQGLQGYINDQFAKVGGDRISITPGGGGAMMGPPSSSSLTAATLTDKDLKVINQVNGVEFAFGGNIFSGSIEFEGERRSGMVFAAPTDQKSHDYITKVDYYVVDQGRYLRDGDKFQVQVGPETGKQLFNKEIRIGNKLLIEGYEFVVVGINKKTGTPFQDWKVTIPLKTGQDIFNRPDELSVINAKVAKGYVPADVADEIKKKLRRSRDVKEGEEDFSVQTSESIIATFSTLVNIVTTFVVLIAAISLIVGMVGIMTTMYTSILERTRQIGIMKSVGAKNVDILSIFMVEAGLLGLSGGILGTILGLLISKGAEYFIRTYIAGFNSYISLELVAGALLFSFLIGCISGYFPSQRAAKMNPVDALRYV
jgi:putative ABC transport system permease protein